MPAVMLNPGWPGTFHRSVKNAKGETLKVLEFTQGEPQLLDDAEFAAVKGDVGRSLVEADVDSDGVPTGRVARAKSAEPRKPAAAQRVEPKAKSADMEKKAPV